MLSARAYSFRQKSRLAISLSWIGGYTNVVALLTAGSIASHVTGTTTSIGQHVADGQLGLAAFFFLLVFCFFTGAVLSAIMTEGARRRGSRSKYVLPVAVEAFLLTLFAVMSFQHGHVEPAELGWRCVMAGIASMAMGLQNATITNISGSVIRTTHVTGVVTDLGIELVQFLHWWRDSLRGRWSSRASRLARVSSRHPTFLRLLLLASIFGSFLLGATLGTLVAMNWPALAMLPPVLFLGWIIIVDSRKPIADVRELDLLSDPEFKAAQIVKSMLPPELGIYRSVGRRGGDHQTPNFQLWLDLLPPKLRVLILAINPLTRFDTNAVLDLEAALKRLEADGRKLILCGVTPLQVRALDALGVARMMDVSNLCPDLEFAVARGLALIEAMRNGNGRKTTGVAPSAATKLGSI
jgi:uncharacterized membrane protein YoaK (UPF0700 family)/anti-anti-sigma regulatory factor